MLVLYIIYLSLYLFITRVGTLRKGFSDVLFYLSIEKQGFFCKVPLLASSARVLYCLWYHTLNIKRHISARKICRSNALVKSAINNYITNRRKFIFLVRFAFRVRYACVIRVSKISKDAKKCFISKCFVFFCPLILYNKTSLFCKVFFKL